MTSPYLCGSRSELIPRKRPDLDPGRKEKEKEEEEGRSTHRRLDLLRVVHSNDRYYRGNDASRESPFGAGRHLGRE